jgi:hypothetical protein
MMSLRFTGICAMRLIETPSLPLLLHLPRAGL